MPGHCRQKKSAHQGKIAAETWEENIWKREKEAMLEEFLGQIGFFYFSLKVCKIPVLSSRITGRCMDDLSLEAGGLRAREALVMGCHWTIQGGLLCWQS